jgi:hypothetical protein
VALDSEFARRLDHADAIEASIRNQELAFRMQASVPELMELAGELLGVVTPVEVSKVASKWSDKRELEL